MTAVATGQPDFIDRLVHVDSLMWYDGELLGHYTLDGAPVLYTWLNFERLELTEAHKGGTFEGRPFTGEYRQQEAYCFLTEENMKALLENTLTLRNAVKSATKIWFHEYQWPHADGHGTNENKFYCHGWKQMTWDEFPQESIGDVMLEMDK